MILHIPEFFLDDCNLYSLPETCTVSNNNQKTTSLKMLEITAHTLSHLVSMNYMPCHCKMQHGANFASELQM